MKSAIGKEPKIQFGKMIRKHLLAYRHYEADKYGEGEQESWNVITERIERMERHAIRRKLLYAVAAAVVLFVAGGISFWLHSGRIDGQSIEELAQTLSTQEIGNNKILLVTTGEKLLNVDDDASLKYKSDGTVIVNSQTVGQEVKSDTNESPVYNQIIVPKGKRTHIYFADGTHIYVNSGTKVTYPAVFSKEKREIYVDGEVYLEVKRDVNRPFYVKAEGMSVQVLGTSFGVCAYKEDKESSVVLVSGKVEVETNAEQIVTLAPDELFSMKNSEISTRKVDASEYVCWTQGLMIFNKEPLDKVFNRLSRYYGQDIRYKGSAGEPYYVSGKLDLRDSLEEVLRLVTGFAPVAFDKTENVITVELIK